MFQLRCAVRNCTKLLAESDGGLSCAAGHHFDRAKEGYWSLLQPQDRKSKTPGDAESAVLARHRWLKRGLGDELITELKGWEALAPSSTESGGNTHVPRTLDLGCGEGSFGAALFAKESDGFCGIDLSKRAIKLAARGWPQATWVLANADRGLPVADGSVHRVVSLFGRRPYAEIARVLATQGNCIIAVPGEEDLIELREEVQQSGHRRSRWEQIVDEFATVGLKHLEHRKWSVQVDLDSEAIADALAMTYRAVRHTQHARAQTLESMRVTLAADLLHFARDTR